jgi:hypothetical protein
LKTAAGLALWLLIADPGYAEPAVAADSLLAIPVVDIIYPRGGSILDREMLSRGRGAVDTASVRAASERRTAFSAAWDTEGPDYLRAALRIVGRPFPYREVQVVLTVSALSSMSSPMLINVRPFLPDAANPAPPGDFVEKVFHELMHHYVAPVRTTSTLMKRYASESPVVLNHLHVMALEAVVLKQLGKTDELRYLEQLYRTDPAPGDYARAWKIVTEIERPEAFVAELRQTGW